MSYIYTLPLVFLIACYAFGDTRRGEPGGNPHVASSPAPVGAGKFHYGDRVKVKAGFFAGMTGSVEDQSVSCLCYWVELDKAPRTVYEHEENLEIEK